jgi:putative aldouronate transport system permease protein
MKAKMVVQPLLAVHKHPQKRLGYYLLRDKYLYLFLLPGLLYFLVFQYLPMLGLVIAFQNYNPIQGVMHSEWVGLEHFRRLWSYPDFGNLLRNTLLISFYRILFFFPIPILFSLMLNEVRKSMFKRMVQSITYLPHFLSWVAIAGLTFAFLSTQGGVINTFLLNLGFQQVNFLASPEYFRSILVFQGIWKESGWGSIIFLAALAGVNSELYEAAKMDGASRIRQIWHVSLPALKSTILVLLILRIGHILDAGFEQVLIMYKPIVYEVGDIIDTFVYRQGIVEGDFSFVTAVGLFKSTVGVMLVLLANFLAKYFNEEGIY